MSLEQLTSSRQTEATLPARRSITWLLPVTLLVGFLAVIALLFGKRLLPAVEVDTAPVVTIRLVGESDPTPPSPSKTNTQGKMLFQASGWVEPDPYTTYLPTLINGVIDKVFVLEGQVVKKEELIATLIDDDAKLNLRQAKQKIIAHQARITAHCAGSDIAQAELVAAQKKIDSHKAELAEAEDHRARMEAIPDGAVSTQQVVQARLATTQKRAQVAVAESQIPRLRARLEQIEFERIAMTATLSELETARDRAQLAMNRTRITSPMDGRILHLHAAPGKKRMLDMDDPKSAVIVELYNPNQLQARIDIPLNEAAGLRIGQAVELVSDLLPDLILMGKVTRISGEADLQRNTLQAKVSIKNPDHRLRPEMLLRAKFYDVGSDESSNAQTSSSTSQRLALYAPVAAIVNESTVWVVTPEHTAEQRQIELGNERRDDHRRVLTGLRSGEHVILPPHTELKEGIRIRHSQRK
ncbi:MAG: efflux RND transporter periplasmic adaptor subunit [Verrucomicrobiae bacterium]|nr:efflux RND transporter periplasmic adaptor subunit [Verrucomicrobiae bacterium]NNJ43034.1 HlyD family efflux transporter periplasmic adaptor subunit [Akkermansiaceae bacterium]